MDNYIYNYNINYSVGFFQYEQNIFAKVQNE